MLATVLCVACYGDHAESPVQDVGLNDVADAVQDVAAEVQSDVPADSAPDSVLDGDQELVPDVAPDLSPDTPPEPPDDSEEDSSVDADLSGIDPAASSVTTSPESKPADGLTAFEILVTVVTGDGTAVADVPVTLVTTGGSGLIVLQPLATGQNGVTTGRIMAIDGGEITVEAKVGTGDAAVLLDQSATLSFSGCTTTADYYRRGVRGPVFSTCAGCHNDYGLAIEEPWKSFPLWHIDDRIDDATVSATLATLTPLAQGSTSLPGGASMSTLLAKPTGNTGHAGGLLIEDGTAARAHLETFVERLLGGSDCQDEGPDLFEGVTLLSDVDTLHKAALTLTGRVSTLAETQALATSGDLAQVIEEHLLVDPAFYTRLQDLYNDVLLTDRVLGTFKLIAHLSQGDYPDRFYFRKYQQGKANYNNPVYTCGDPGNGEACCEDVDTMKDVVCDDGGIAKTFCDYADSYAVQNLRRQGLALIAYVVKHDKPFTEILTANYAVVNPALARLFGVLDTPGGVSFDDHCDLTDWKAVQLEMDNLQGVTEANTYPSSKVPHAGIFSTHTFLNRFMTTTTNLNRLRTSMVMKRFLDIEIESLVSFTVGQEATQQLNPTKDELTCSVCHSVMDPIAGSFHKWTGLGHVRRDRVWHVCTQFLEPNCTTSEDCANGYACVDSVCVAPGYEPSLCVRSIGYQGEPMPAVAAKAPLRWMTSKMATDPRFATATVKTMLTLLTGREVLVAPTQPGDPSYAATIRAYIAQEEEVSRVTKVFVDNGYDFKSTLIEIVTGPWFRAENGSVSGAQSEALLAGQVGGNRLRTPEELALRVRSVTGFPWVTLGGRLDSLLSATKGYKTIYGGIDSAAITRRMRDPFAVASAVARRMANEMGCLTVPQDFAWTSALDRTFFVLLDVDTDTLDAGGQPTNVDAVESTIELLHRVFLNEAAPPGSDAFNETYDLLLKVWEGGLARVSAGTEPLALPQRCRATKDLTDGKLFAESEFPNREPVLQDPNYVIRSWMAVVSYLLSDARFLLN